MCNGDELRREALNVISFFGDKMHWQRFLCSLLTGTKQRLQSNIQALDIAL
eukprot:COSAG03_NODE_14015_length_480_cov_0.674541_1_plen_50_part_10